MIQRLKKLGLTRYEAQVYISLLELGDATANEISNHSKIPMGRIYGVLSRLEKLQLIHSQASRPKRYVCVSPGSALDRLSNNIKKQLDYEKIQIDNLVQDLNYELSNIKKRRTEKTFWTVSLGDESHSLLIESINNAKNEILYFMASRVMCSRLKKAIKDNKHSDIIKSLSKTIEKGVEVKVILNKEFEQDILSDTDVKKLFKYIGKGLDYKFATTPATPFDIIDKEIVTLKVMNPVNPEELLAVINIRDKALAKELREKFFVIWDKAV